MNIDNEVKSIREQLGVNYNRPSLDKLIPFWEGLWAEENVVEYLIKDRGLTKETCEHFKLGYDPKTKSIVIPVFKRGELIDIKYYYITPKKETHTSEPKAESWIFNEDGLQKGIAKGSILIVQNEFDLMSAWQQGSINVIATSGKESHGTWIEYIDSIPKVLIAYDNTPQGKDASSKLAERLGTDKCFEILYPEGTKDANEFFKKYTKDDFIKLAKDSRPYYTHKFKGLGDIINTLSNNNEPVIYSRLIPLLKIKSNSVITLSADTSVGKSTFALNFAEEMSEKGFPCLIMPFEDGVENSGKRFLQIKYNLGEDEILMQSKNEWEKIKEKCIDLPIYFSVPDKKNALETIIKSKRFFDVKYVIVDHVQWMLKGSANLNSDISEVVKELRGIANQYGITIIIVAHIRKLNNSGGWKEMKEPGLDDLKDSSSLKQDVPIVVMLTQTEEGYLKVNPLKSKGKCAIGFYHYNKDTGRIGNQVDDIFAM